MLHLVSTSSKSTTNCFPTNWNYAWSKVGNVWFTRTRGSGNWYTMMRRCQDIDLGQSSIASIRSRREQLHVTHAHCALLPHENWWIGGFRFGGRKWIWTSMINDKITTSPIKYENWDPNQPYSRKYDHCALLQSKRKDPLRKWRNVNCMTFQFRALCEIRCKKSNRQYRTSKG